MTQRPLPHVDGPASTSPPWMTSGHSELPGTRVGPIIANCNTPNQNFIHAGRSARVVLVRQHTLYNQTKYGAQQQYASREIKQINALKDQLTPNNSETKTNAEMIN